MSDKRDVGRVVFVGATLLVLLYGACNIAAAAYGQLALWDERALDDQRIDYSWELDLMLLADDGLWSGVAFQNPRGPLFQLLLWAPSAAHHSVARRLISAQVLFQVVCVGFAIALAFVFVRDRHRRLLAAFVLSSLGFAAGIETLRALASAAVVLLFGSLAARHRKRPWRGAALTAMAVAVAGALSFERWMLAWLAIVTMHVCEQVGLRLRGAKTREGWRRLGRVAVAQLAVVLALGLGLFVAGGSPFAYIAESYDIGVVYASVRSTPWVAREVTPAMVGGFLALALAIAMVSMAGAPRQRRIAMWIAGAATFAVFTIFRPHPGHVFLGLAPLTVVLTVIASAHTRAPQRKGGAWALWVRGVGERGARALRTGPAAMGAGALLTLFLVVWFHAYPESLWWRVSHLHQGIGAYRGELVADTDYVTEIGQAARWLQTNGEGSCFGAHPGATALYAMVGGRGPTRGRLRWVSGGPSELARAIREQRCPFYVQQLYSFDHASVAGLAFGRDFLAIAELYESHARVGPSTWILKLREQPREARARVVELSPPHRASPVQIGEPIRLDLSEPIAGHELLEITYRLALDAPLPPPFVNTPRVYVRFSNGGEPVGEWQPVYQRSIGQSTAALASPDPEAAEHRFLLERPLHREVSADAVELVLRGVGWRSATSARLTIEGARVLTHPSVTIPPPAAWCDRRRNLRGDLDGTALLRNVGPGELEAAFDMHANAPLDFPPEAFFPVQPCPGSCLATRVALPYRPEAPPSDGFVFEMHVFDRENRALLVQEQVDPGMSVEHVVPLEDWDRRPILLRFGVTANGDEHGDYARIEEAVIRPCEEPVNPWADPLVFPVAAELASRRELGEVGLAAGWARRRLLEGGGGCVAVRSSIDALARVHSLVQGLDAVTWGPGGLLSIGDARAYACGHLLYFAGSFDSPARAGSSLDASWRDLFARFSPVERVGPSVWLLRQRGEPVEIERRPLRVRATSPERATLSPRLGEAQLAELRYQLHCEGATPEVLPLHLYDEGRRRDAEPYRVPLGPDHSGGGTVWVSANPTALERRWAGGINPTGPGADEVGVLLPDGCELEWLGGTSHSPPDPPRAGPMPDSCQASLDLASAVADHSVWMRATRWPLDEDVLRLRTHTPEQHMPELFTPFVPCARTCFTVEAEAVDLDEGDVSLEVHLIAGWDRPRIVLLELDRETPAATATVALDAWAGRDMLLRVGLLPRNGNAVDVVLHQARVGPCRPDGSP